MPPHKADKAIIYHGCLDEGPPPLYFKLFSIAAFQIPIIEIRFPIAARTVSGNFRPFASGPLK
jgi:hypothetical protein